MIQEQQRTLKQRGRPAVRRFDPVILRLVDDCDQASWAEVLDKRLEQ